MPDTPVPKDYTDDTVEDAQDDLAIVSLGIEVAEVGGTPHVPGAAEMTRVIDTNAPGSKKGQPRPTNGNAVVILKTV